jgi:hypothetical protein
MDPSNSNLELLDIKVVELIREGSPENHRTIGLCESVVNGLVQELKPIVKYVCQPRDIYHGEGMIEGPEKMIVHCVLVCEVNEKMGKRVYLDKKGEFFSVIDTFPDNRETTLDEGYEAWLGIPFSTLFTSLHAILVKAREKRDERNRKINNRERLLESILTTIREFTPN